MMRLGCIGVIALLVVALCMWVVALADVTQINSYEDVSYDLTDTLRNDLLPFNPTIVALESWELIGTLTLTLIGDEGNKTRLLRPRNAMVLYEYRTTSWKLHYTPPENVYTAETIDDCVTENILETFELRFEDVECTGCEDDLIATFGISFCIVSVDDAPQYPDMIVSVPHRVFKKILLVSTDIENFELENSRVFLNITNLKGDIYGFSCPEKGNIDSFEKLRILPGEENQFFSSKGSMEVCYRSPLKSTTGGVQIRRDGFQYSVKEFDFTDPTNPVEIYRGSPAHVEIQIESPISARSSILAGTLDEEFDVPLKFYDTAPDEPNKTVYYTIDSIPILGKLIDKSTGIEIIELPFDLPETTAGMAIRVLQYIPEIANALPDAAAARLRSPSPVPNTTSDLLEVSFRAYSSMDYKDAATSAQNDLRVVIERRSPQLSWSNPAGYSDDLDIRGLYYNFSTKPEIVSSPSQDIFPAMLEVNIDSEHVPDGKLLYRFNLSQRLTLDAFTIFARPVFNESLRDLLFIDNFKEKAIESFSRIKPEEEVPKTSCIENGCNSSIWIIGSPLVLNAALRTFEITNLYSNSSTGYLTLNLYDLRTNAWVPDTLAQIVGEKISLKGLIQTCGTKHDDVNCPVLPGFREDLTQTLTWYHIAAIALIVVAVAGRFTGHAIRYFKNLKARISKTSRFGRVIQVASGRGDVSESSVSRAFSNLQAASKSISITTFNPFMNTHLQSKESEENLSTSPRRDHQTR